MAASLTVQLTGGRKPLAPFAIDRVLFDSDGDAYTTGGFDLTAELALKLSDRTLIAACVSKHPLGFVADIDIPNKKLRLQSAQAGPVLAEVAAGGLAAQLVEVMVFSI